MNVKELRKKSGLTQDELSEKTGIPRGRIAKWEQGKGNPKSADEKILDNIFGKFVREQVPKNGVVVPNKPQHGDNSQKQGLDLIKEVSRLDDDQLRIMATLKVLVSEIESLIVKNTGRSPASVSLQLEKDISENIENLKTLRGRM